jgi:phage terminase large subunit-like protein
VSVTVREAWVDLDSRIRRRETDETVGDEAARLSRSFFAFTEAAWPLIIPGRYVRTWHIETLCEHVQAAYEREIARLLVTIPPGFLKSSIFSVLGPAWRWAVDPRERFVTASHSDDLATRDTRRSRTLIQTEWFQQRWPTEMTGDENLKTRYSNTVGGHRIRTHVGGGTGDRGSILQVDDPHNATDAYSEVRMQAAVDWWSDTWASRLDDSVEARGVKIVIGQRISEDDLIGHLLANDEDAGRWQHLCLPVEYEPAHPFVYPDKRTLPSGRVIQGDVRAKAGELLAPAYMDDDRLADKTADMTAHIYAGQYQQRPAPKEGKLLKRANWRYYPPAWSFYSQDRFTAEIAKTYLPKFDQIVHSWDTSVKDRAKSDFVSGGVWGVIGADRWLVRLYHERAGLNATVEAMLELAMWSDGIWPTTPHRVIVEAAANGPDAVREIRSRVQGVISWQAIGPKYQRAEAAAPALDGRNCFLPGYPTPEEDSYDTRTPKPVQDFVEELAAFDQAVHDDHVDQWSMMVNWTRAHARRKGKASRSTGRLPRPSRLPS